MWTSGSHHEQKTDAIVLLPDKCKQTGAACITSHCVNHCWLLTQLLPSTSGYQQTSRNTLIMTTVCYTLRLHPEQQVVKVIWHKTTSPPHMDDSIVFARWRQCAFPCRNIGATWRIRLNLCFLWPTLFHLTQTANWSVQPFLHSARQKVSILYNGRPFPPKLPHLMGGSAPSSNLRFLIGMLDSVFSCNRSSIVQNRILTEARSIPVDAHHAMNTENAMRNRKRRLT